MDFRASCVKNDMPVPTDPVIVFVLLLENLVMFDGRIFLQKSFSCKHTVVSTESLHSVWNPYQ